MQTHKITLSYPTSGLTVNVEIRNRATNAVLETGVATENGTTATYDYDFDGADNTDYIYIASVSGLNTIKGAVFYETASGGGGGGASVADIWGAQITDYANTAGSFANKFAQYGGVSHVIDRSSLDEESKKELKGMREKLELFSKALDKIKTVDVERFENAMSSINSLKNVPPQIIKTESKYEETIGELLSESIPLLIEKLDDATQLIPLYEEMLTYMEKREKDWESLVEELITNNN